MSTTFARARASSSTESPKILPPLLHGLGEPPRLHLMGAFDLERQMVSVELPHAAQRLIAFLALKGRAVSRSVAAGTLWPQTREARAAGNLRSALWRVRQAGSDIVRTSGSTVALDPAIVVDLHEIIRDAHGCLDGQEVGDLAEGLCRDLLPDWYDDWIVIERESLRQLRVHTLELLCRRSLADGFPARAIDIGLAAVAIEPLRESVHRALISAHLAEGNASEALRQFERFRRLVREELGIDPSGAMNTLVYPLLALANPNASGAAERH